MTICTCNARTLASEACVEDLMMHPRMIKYDVIRLTETRRHQPLHVTYDSGEELFLGTCDISGRIHERSRERSRLPTGSDQVRGGKERREMRDEVPPILKVLVYVPTGKAASKSLSRTMLYAILKWGPIETTGQKHTGWDRLTGE
ncbi:unnamed protein product [Heligmosomoides polygyrus]|uniref:Uncharacterized protein n=1 Tax=Heligmosomoides polygyrus TaxID=6339 RepID=A0A183F7W3_HELPZ|nr:unnamed protein product [Heligmosomoides polygyrus]